MSCERVECSIARFSHRNRNKCILYYYSIGMFRITLRQDNRVYNVVGMS